MKNELILELPPPEPEKETPETLPENPAPKKKNRIAQALASLASGKFLISKTTLSNLPFVLYLTLLGVCYIANGYYAQSKDRELDKLNAEIEDIHSRYVIAQSQLMYLSKESEVARLAAPQGLKESLVPPEKIVVNDNDKPVRR